MRLAILGNSHTACLLHALRDENEVSDGIEVTFFASIGKNMADFELDGQLLVPQTDYLRDSIKTTSGGSESFDPNAFDAILMVGLGFNLAPVDYRLSLAVREAIAKNSAQSSNSWKLASLIREVSNTPIFVGHSPLRAGDIHENNQFLVDNALPYNEVVTMVQQVWDQMNVTVVQQPEHTRFMDVLTRRSYSRGSRGLRGAGLEHENKDRSHMNEEYGADYIRNMRPLLGLS